MVGGLRSAEDHDERRAQPGGGRRAAALHPIEDERVPPVEVERLAEVRFEVFRLQHAWPSPGWAASVGTAGLLRKGARLSGGPVAAGGMSVDGVDSEQIA